MILNKMQRAYTMCCNEKCIPAGSLHSGINDLNGVVLEIDCPEKTCRVCAGYRRNCFGMSYQSLGAAIFLLDHGRLNGRFLPCLVLDCTQIQSIGVDTGSSSCGAEVVGSILSGPLKAYSLYAVAHVRRNFSLESPSSYTDTMLSLADASDSQSVLHTHDMSDL